MILIGMCAFCVTLAMLFLLLKTRLYSFALDQPNHRSLHTRLVPRTGGVAVITGILTAWIVADNTWLWTIPVAVLLLVSLIDDVRDLSVRWRLLTQLVVSAGLSVAVFPEYPWWLHIPIVLSMTWIINLYNFMDGSDGLAGGMALFGFSSYAVAAAVSHDFHIVALSVAVVAASFAFLLLNFHPARIFLGDSGSIPLGFLAGAIGLFGWQRELWPLWFPLLVFSPFIIDASVTLLKRLLRREKVWEAHRSHYYQRLIQLGWTHRKTAIAEYCLMIATGASAVFLIRQPQSIVLVVLIIWLLSYFAIMQKIDKQWGLQSCHS